MIRIVRGTKFPQVRFLPVALGMLFLLVIAACQKPQLAGEELLPEFAQDNMFQTDTLTILAQTELMDTVTSSNLSATQHLLGSFNDPFFGQTEATIFTQFLPSSTPSFPDNIAIDSVVLALSYTGRYGAIDKLRGVQKVNVYALDEAIQDTARYTTFTDHPNGSLLGSKTFWPDLAHNVTLTTEVLSPQLRIPLSLSFGDQLLQSDQYASDAVFVAAFKGLAIRPNNGPLPVDHGAILYFNLASPQSRVELYYHTTNVGDTTKYPPFIYKIGTSAASHTRITHSYPQELVDQLGRTDFGQEKLFVHATAGTRVRLSFPYLKELNELGNIAINKAELILPIEEWTDATYPPAQQLICQRLRADTLVGITDVGNLTYFGGVYNATDKEYRMNIALYLQQALLGDHDADPDLFIVMGDHVQIAPRTILNGPGHAEKPLKLRILYTKLDP